MNMLKGQGLNSWSLFHFPAISWELVQQIEEKKKEGLQPELASSKQFAEPIINDQVFLRILEVKRRPSHSD